jgi:alpha-mannosidase
MLSRPEHAGVPCETPEAQCQGRHTFEYAIRPHAGTWQAVYREATEFQAPLYVRRGDETEGYLPDEVWSDYNPNAFHGQISLKKSVLSGELPGELSFLTLDPPDLVLSAVKRSEGGDSLIVRFYNPTSEAAQANLRTYQPMVGARAVNLNEEPEADLPLTDAHSLTLPVAAKQVRTVAIQF